MSAASVLRLHEASNHYCGLGYRIEKKDALAVVLRLGVCDHIFILIRGKQGSAAEKGALRITFVEGSYLHF